MDFSWGVNSLVFISQMIVVHCENGEFINPPELLTFVWGGKSITLFFKNSIPHTVVNGCVCFYLTVAIPYCIYELLSFLWFKKKHLIKKHDEVISCLLSFLC